MRKCAVNLVKRNIRTCWRRDDVKRMKSEQQIIQLGNVSPFTQSVSPIHYLAVL